VHLTKAGEELIARVFPRHAKVVASEFAFLNKEEKAGFTKILKSFNLDK
jgi:MarR family 2-MHQ and catechol resistance regulon transcriptional repressor